MSIEAMLSSQSNLWETPDDFFNSLNQVFRFDLDVCASHGTAKCEEYYTPAEDGLTQDWKGRTCWMNPPYGREIPKWMEKAYKESLKGATVVCLIPSRTDTAYWHDYVLGGCATVINLRGRLKFKMEGVQKDPAPFPCSIVIFWGCF